MRDKKGKIMKMNLKEMNKHDITGSKAASDSAALEETLASFGALAAVSTVRRCFPVMENRAGKRFGN
jgi:hypothetical protein